MSEQQTPEPHLFTATPRIEWNVPAEIKSRYATLFAAQATQHEITISFFEPQIPVFVGTPEEVAAQAQELVSVRADCVGRIIVAAEQVHELIMVLESSLNAYQAAQVLQKETAKSTEDAASKGA